MERIKIWAQAAGEDLLDANKLADMACRMSKLGDASAAREFAERSRTHLEYVKEAKVEINRIIANLKPTEECPDMESKIQALRLSTLEDERDFSISLIEKRLVSL